MFKFILQFFILFIFLTCLAKAEEFNNILINGNERVSEETILVFSDLSNKNFLDENSINDVLKKLYDSGFFSNISIVIENKNLIIDVEENPIIQTVFIEGIKKKKLEESLFDVLTLKNRSSFNSFKAKKDVDKILNFLRTKGYYFSKVVSSSQDLGSNKINLIYKIELGKKARITKISFIGDKKFKDNTLRNVILSEEFQFWKIVSGKKFLNESLIELDKKLLNNFYKNKGFYDAFIETSFANYLGGEEFELIYSISSGKKYYFDNLSITLPIGYDKKDFNKLIKIFDELKGEPYSLNSINKILNGIDKIVAKEKYEFLKSNVDEKISDNLINLTFNIDESEKFYVEKINIFGNNITREDVIRNLFVVDEGDAFNQLLHKKTLNNLRSLNFFKTVNEDIINGTLENQKVINITVEEKPTGEISAGAGVGTGGGTLAFGVQENNFLGRGLKFGTDITLSQESVKGEISLNDPNYKGTNRSLDFSAQSQTTDRLQNFGYKSSKTGFSIGSGFEFYEDLFLNIGTSSYFEDLETDSTASATMKKQNGSYFDTFFNYTFAYDMRDQSYKPTNGFISRFTQNVPLISKNYTLTNSYDIRIYEKFFDENIASYSLFASSTNALSGKDVKLSERLFLRENRLRGFETGKIGPMDGADFIGGNYTMAFNANATLPQIFPTLQNTTFSLFFDAANVWGVDYNKGIADGGKIRTSVGLAVDFFTPIGPLNFSLSEPITKSKNDVTEFFRFNLGTTF
jgi:outer membrane protein insertion porin family